MTNLLRLPRSLRRYFILVLVIISGLFAAKILPVLALGSPVKISTTTTNDVVFPQIASDGSGYQHVVWQELIPNQNWFGTTPNPGIFYSRWNGDTWSAPLKISANTYFSENPAVVADNSNTAYVVWNEFNASADNTWRIHYKTRPSTGTWSAMEILSLAGDSTGDWAPKIALDNSNNPHIVHTTNTPGGNIIYWRQKVSGSWNTPSIVSFNSSGETITDSQWADLKSDASGNLHLVYWSWSQGVFYRNYNGTSWSTPVLITPARVQYPRIAVTPLGEVFVTWFQPDDNSIRVRWTSSSVWQSETTLTTLATNSFWGYPIMGVTTDSKERAHVGWGEKDAGNLIDLKFRTFQSGSWGLAQDVDLDNNDADSPFVFRDKWDNQHFVWTEYNPTSTLWELMYRVSEGTIQTVGTGGGTITANPGGTTYATLNIPSGALSSSTQIGIQIGPVPESVDQNQITIPRSFTFRPSGLVFNSASTATVFYTDSEVAGVDERELKPWFWNSQLNNWEARTGSVNQAQNRIAISLSGFSLYGISAPRVAISWVKPTANYVHTTTKEMAVEFNMTYADGTAVMAVDTNDDLKFEVLDASSQTVKSYPLGPTNPHNPPTKFKTTINPASDGIPNGNYTLQVYLVGNPVGPAQPFTVALPSPPPPVWP